MEYFKITYFNVNDGQDESKITARSPEQALAIVDALIRDDYSTVVQIRREGQ